MKSKSSIHTLCRPNGIPWRADNLETKKKTVWSNENYVSCFHKICEKLQCKGLYGLCRRFCCLRLVNESSVIVNALILAIYYELVEKKK